MQVKVQKVETSNWDFMAHRQGNDQADAGVFGAVLDAAYSQTKASAVDKRSSTGGRDAIESATDAPKRADDGAVNEVVDDELTVVDDISIDDGSEVEPVEEMPIEDSVEPEAVDENPDDNVDPAAGSEQELSNVDDNAVMGEAVVEPVVDAGLEVDAAAVGQVTDGAEDANGTAVQENVVASGTAAAGVAMVDGEGDDAAAAAGGEATTAAKGTLEALPSDENGQALPKPEQNTTKLSDVTNNSQPVVQGEQEGKAVNPKEVIETLTGNVEASADTGAEVAESGQKPVEGGAAQADAMPMVESKLPSVNRPDSVVEQQVVEPDTDSHKTERSNNSGVNISQVDAEIGAEAVVKVESTISGGQAGNDFSQQRHQRYDGSALTAVSGESSAVSGSDGAKVNFAAAMEREHPVEMQENVDNIVRMARTAYTRGSSRIQISLQPAELGTLRVDIRQDSQGLTLRFEASTPRAQELLQQNASELRAALESQGMGNAKIDVQLRMDVRSDANGQNADNQDGSGRGQGSQQGSQQDSYQGQSQSEGQQYVWQSLDDTESQGHGGPYFSAGGTDGIVEGSAGGDEWQELTFENVNVLV
ncbi:MAG: flagellar hook-length control protein FliK [Sedimentisphaerales bacterium]|nr:flagellar hook-length control protein FliK [Sedimentisphaerales bacterium]